MSDKPVPGGYIDRAALARALNSHRGLVAVVEALITEDGMTRTRYAHLLEMAGLHLAQQRDALAQMEAVRRGGPAEALAE